MITGVETGAPSKSQQRRGFSALTVTCGAVTAAGCNVHDKCVVCKTCIQQRPEHAVFEM